MSEFLNLRNYQMTAQNIGAAPANSEVIDLQGASLLAVQVQASAVSGVSAASATLQYTLDGTNWHNEGTAVNITTNAVLAPFIKDRPPGLKYRMAYANAAGSFTATVTVVGKGLV